jgi:hypothetical protein
MRTPLVLSLLALLLSPPAALAGRQAGPASAPTFADPTFARLWSRTDSLVANNQVINRSWYWGPGPGVAMQEAYAQAPGGQRLVQYFDKARMEINQPNGDRTSPWFVTTGLLVEDMVSGNMQVGDTQFVGRGPAQIVVAGDANDPAAPTYASFRGVASINNANRAAKQLGGHVTSTLNRAGQIGVDVTKGRDAGATLIAYNDVFGHNIPSALWEFMNAAGVVNADGQTVVDRPVMNWIFTVGYPITEAFWTRVKIAGAPTDVLIQLFERRALVYVPSYRAPWNVQMANVGTHYFQWRYGPAAPAPAATAPAPPPPAPPASPTAAPPTIPPPTLGLPPAPATPPRPPSPPPAEPTGTPPPPPPPPPGASPTPGPPPPPTQPPLPPQGPITVNPTSGTRATSFSFTGAGFAAGEPVANWYVDPSGRYWYPSGGRALTANASGQVSGQVVPNDAFYEVQTGNWTINLHGLSSGRDESVSFSIH